MYYDKNEIRVQLQIQSIESRGFVNIHTVWCDHARKNMIMFSLLFILHDIFHPHAISLYVFQYDIVTFTFLLDHTIFFGSGSWYERDDTGE